MKPVSAFVVVERELVRLGRRWQTSASRTTFAAFVFALVGVVYAGQWFAEDFISVSALAQLGRGLFLTWSGTLFTAIVLLTPTMVAQAIIDEKEEHTLSLLAITRLTPRRILWGTLLSRLVMMETLLLAVMPVLALVLGFGGVGLLEMFGAVVHANVVMLVTGAVATFLSLYARSVVVVSVQTWFWLLTAMVASSALGGFAAVGAGGTSSSVMLTNPVYAFAGVGAGQVRGLQALLVPTGIWVFVAVAVMHVTSLCFETLALGEKDPDEADADLSTGFWGFESYRRKLWPVAGLLFLSSPILAAPQFASTSLPVLPEFVVWVWTAMVLAVGGTLYLLAVRRTSLKRARKAKTSVVGRAGWEQLSAHFDAVDSQGVEASRPDGQRDVAATLQGTHTRKGRVLSPLQREVWQNPIRWREVSTSAHGRLRRALVGWYVVFGLFFLLLAALGELDEGGAAVVFGIFLLAPMPLFTLLLATSSIVGERRAGTLELLCVTPLSGSRIVTEKLVAVFTLLGPGVLVGALMIIGGSLDTRGASPVDAMLGVLWFLAVNVNLALLCMWRALSVKHPSRAWASNLAFVFLLSWLIGITTGLLQMLEPLLWAWSVVMPFGIAGVDEDLVTLYLLVSLGFWSMMAFVLGLRAARAITRTAAKL